MMKTRTTLGAVLAAAVLTTLIGGPALAVATNPPSAPVDLLAEDTRIEGTSIALSWTDTSYTQTDPDNETAFEIERCTGAGCTDFAPLMTQGPGMGWALDDSPKTEDTVYTYRVRAINDAGASAYTNTSSATTSWHRPGQPSDFVATYADGAVAMSWTDNADNETSYVVERCEIGVCLATEPVAVLAPDTTTWQDTDLLLGTAYFYRVRAARHTIDSGYSEPVELRAGEALAAPRALATTGRTTAVKLTWRNRARGKVQVWRCDTDCVDLSGHWSRLGASWTSVAVLPGRASSYVDRHLASGSSYVYRIRTARPHAVSHFKFADARTR